MSPNLEIMALIIKMDYTRLVGWSPAGSKIYHLPYRHASHKVYEKKKKNARAENTSIIIGDLLQDGKKKGLWACVFVSPTIKAYFIVLGVETSRARSCGCWTTGLSAQGENTCANIWAHVTCIVWSDSKLDDLIRSISAFYG